MISLLNANALHIPLASESVQCAITSPPYFGLRDYGTAKWEGGDVACDHIAPARGGHGDKSPIQNGARDIEVMTQQYKGACRKCGAIRVDAQIGLERTPAEYVDNLVSVFREVWRVLRDDGVVWLNLGDSYVGSSMSGGDQTKRVGGGTSKLLLQHDQNKKVKVEIPDGLKPKDLFGIPWRVAFALQADGWYLRSDIIWCLSGGTWVYARTQKGDMPMMVRDMARLDPQTVKLWNGNRWTRVRGWSKSKRKGDELEVVLRSGERVACTPTHQFPTQRGLLRAGDMVVGDVLQRVKLSGPDAPLYPTHLGLDAAWFAGLYIAEGSRSGDKIQIAGHAKEEDRWEKIKAISESYGGSAARTIDGNQMNIRVYGKMLNAVIDQLVTGHTAHDKGFAPVVWRYSNEFLEAMLKGYLDGDGHFDKPNNRWRLGFARNYNLERDLRTVAARLDFHIVLNISSVPYKGEKRPTFRGEIRFERSGHLNEKNTSEIVEINRARCREVYDIGVEDEPNLFALASGILTHNSKPNPMPESVTDRPTKAHEYIFLLSKSATYYYDAEAIAETALQPNGVAKETGQIKAKILGQNGGTLGSNQGAYTRNKRTVWTVATSPFSGAHFATFPPKLVEPMILAGSAPGDLVLDPFSGSGTVGRVAIKHRRRFVGLELNPAYIALAEDRTSNVQVAML